MNDKLIEALERIADMRPGTANLIEARHLAAEALAAHRSQQSPPAANGVEPAGHYAGEHRDGADIVVLYRDLPKGQALYTSSAPSESEARVQAALRRLLRSVPTDGDMVEAGWEKCEIDEACAAIEEAHAALSASGKGEGL